MTAEEFGVPQPATDRVTQWTIEEEAKVRKRFSLLRSALVVVIAAFVCIWTAIFVAHALSPRSASPHYISPVVRYLGVYEPDAPDSYADIDQFSHAIGRQPNIVPYYSHWYAPFAVNFATTAASHGAITLVQIAPQGVSLQSIVSGQYDEYLHKYALEVKNFRSKVILSFGHEMNGKIGRASCRERV